MSVTLEELIAMRETIEAFAAIVERSIQAIQAVLPDPSEGPGEFLDLLEEQNENLAEVLRRCDLVLGDDRLTVKASALDESFVRVHRKALEAFAETFFGEKLWVRVERK